MKMIINHGRRAAQISPPPARAVPAHGPAAAPRTPTLLGTQALFNVGFYAVVPFLTTVLTGDFGLGAAAVGLVLGVRTLAQQGLFIVGGSLADRVGARPVILTGCAVRAAGFLALSAALWAGDPRLWLFIAGTALTGLGGALFSPALNSLIAEIEAVRRTASPTRGAGVDDAAAERASSDVLPGFAARTLHRSPRARASLFAWLAVTGEVGVVVGPLLGAALLDHGFAVVAAAGAALFLAVGAMLAALLPRPVRERRPHRGATALAALRDRRFAAFAALHAADLLAYNQLYLALPLAMAQAGGDAGAVALVFAWVSILTLALQLPLARGSARLGAPRALRIGYLAHAAAFLSLAAAALLPLTQTAALALVTMAATGIAFGHLIANPTALALVPELARPGATGSYFGLLASCGGIAVLCGNLAVGGLFDRASGASAAGPGAAALPWLLLATLPALAAALAPRLLAGRARAN
jgi:MFS family permease